MAKESGVDSGHPRESGLSLFTLFERALNAVGTLGIIALMVLINADVFGRAVLNHPILGVPEIVRLVIVGIVFLQAAHTLASGRLTRSTLGLDVVGKYVPAIRTAMDVFFHIVGAVLFALIAWGGWPQLVKSWNRGEYLGAEGVFAAPVWPVKALVILGCVTVSLQFVRSAVAILRAESMK